MRNSLRAFELDDLPEVVDLSVRAWARVFTSLHGQLGDPLFFRLHSDWEAGQAEAVRSTCSSGELDVLVAVDEPTGYTLLPIARYFRLL